MNESNHRQDRDLKDRLVDLALGEVLAGRRPPDLKERILAASASDQPAPAEAAPSGATGSLSASASGVTGGPSASAPHHDPLALAEPTSSTRPLLRKLAALAACLLVLGGVALPVYFATSTFLGLRPTPPEPPPVYRATAWLRVQGTPDYVVQREGVGYVGGIYTGDEIDDQGARDSTGDKTQWQELTTRRKKYASVDLKKRGEITDNGSSDGDDADGLFFLMERQGLAEPERPSDDDLATDEIFRRSVTATDAVDDISIYLEGPPMAVRGHSLAGRSESAQQALEKLQRERDSRQASGEGKKTPSFDPSLDPPFNHDDFATTSPQQGGFFPASVLLRARIHGSTPDRDVMADEQALKVPLVDLRRRVTSKEVAQELLQAKLRAFEESVETGVIEIPPAEVNAELEKNAELRELRKASRKLRTEISGHLKNSTRGEKDPRYREMARDLNNLERTIDEQTDKLRRSVTEAKVQERIREQTDKLAELRQRVDDNQLEIDLLRKRYFSQREELVNAGGSSMALSFRAAELAREERVFEMIAARIMRLRTEMRSPASVTLLKKATAPSVPLKQEERERESDLPRPRPRSLAARTAEFVASPLVLEQVLAQPEIAALPEVRRQMQPLNWLQGNLHVGYKDDSELFVINFDAADPKHAAMIVNAVVEVYFKMNSEEEQLQTQRVKELLEDARQQRLARITQLRANLAEAQKAVGQRSWKRVVATPNAARLVIGDRDELPLDGMQMSVTVDGFRARVLVDYYFYSDRRQQLEGTLKIRLPDEASLYYFAFGATSIEYRPQANQVASVGFLPPEAVRASGTGPEDILRARSGSWSDVKVARIVPREKAARAYGETVRRRIDPALVEWAGAGVFNARVFPLLPGKLHRIVIGYDVNLTREADDWVYHVELPEGVPQRAVDLDVAALAGSEAEVTPDVRPFLTGGRAFYHIRDPKESTIAIRIKEPQDIAVAGGDATGKYFAARFVPDLPAGELVAGSERAVFLLDTSLSSQPDKFNLWLKLLEATLTRNRQSLREFAVLCFDIDHHWWKPGYTANTPENVAALMEYCQSLSLEGATDVAAALREATAPAWLEKPAEKPDDAAAPPDLFLLSDGAATWGERDVAAIAQALDSDSGALFAYKTGLTGTAVELLEALARASGGAVFAVAGEDEVQSVATAHRRRPWQLESLEVAGCNDLLLAGRPHALYTGQQLLLVGRGELPPDANVTLKVRRADEARTVSTPLERVVASELAVRAYGQVAVGQLEELGDATHDVSVAYARHFRVTGHTCSLLMLDSEADYQRFAIKPENDQLLVQSTAAGGLVERLLAELGSQLADPKRALLAWLERLEQTPGMTFHTPAALKLAIDQLPAEAFRVAVPPLRCKTHGKAELSEKYQEQLAAAELDYRAIRAESKRRLESLGADDALRSLSSLVERSPGDMVLARDVALSALEWGLGGQAIGLLRQVAEARPYEPQVYLALGQALAECGHADLAAIYYEVAASGKWNNRYGEINRIAAVEYLNLLRRMASGELASFAPQFAKARLASLAEEAGLTEADLVVTMQWNTDRTDVDLHVVEPSGEVCFFQHKHTASGGQLSTDVTGGFGPEMYVLREAPPGEYRLLASYFASDANRTQVDTKVYLVLYRNFGRTDQEVTRRTVTLTKSSEKLPVASIKLGK